MTQVMIVVPARYASTRLERKMLLSKTGKPLIQHTYEAASQATQASKVLVATDHPEIERAVRHFGGEAIMTDPNAQSGTDRIAEVARAFSDYELVVNVQGDEPEIEPEAIDLAIRILREDSTAMMSTLATPIRTPETLSDPEPTGPVLFEKPNPISASAGKGGFLGADALSLSPSGLVRLPTGFFTKDP